MRYKYNLGVQALWAKWTRRVHKMYTSEYNVYRLYSIDENYIMIII